MTPAPDLPRERAGAHRMAARAAIGVLAGFFPITPIR